LLVDCSRSADYSLIKKLFYSAFARFASIKEQPTGQILGANKHLFVHYVRLATEVAFSRARLQTN
jgi:hypothetical protein